MGVRALSKVDKSLETRVYDSQEGQDLSEQHVVVYMSL